MNDNFGIIRLINYKNSKLFREEKRVFEGKEKDIHARYDSLSILNQEDGGITAFLNMINP